MGKWRPYPLTHTCPQCGIVFSSFQPRARFCSSKCRMSYHDDQQFKQRSNFPPDLREKFIENELNKIVKYLCWYHGLSEEHPYIQGVIHSAKSDYVDKNLDGGNFPEQNCRQCGRPFKPQRRWQWFCTSNCDEENHEANLQWRK